MEESAPIFESLKFMLFGHCGRVAGTIKADGGTIVREPTRLPDYVIVGELDEPIDLAPFEGKSHRFYIVSPEWVTDSVHRGTLLNPRWYSALLWSEEERRDLRITHRPPPCKTGTDLARYDYRQPRTPDRSDPNYIPDPHGELNGMPYNLLQLRESARRSTENVVHQPSTEEFNDFEDSQEASKFMTISDTQYLIRCYFDWPTVPFNMSIPRTIENPIPTLPGGLRSKRTNKKPTRHQDALYKVPMALYDIPKARDPLQRSYSQSEEYLMLIFWLRSYPYSIAAVTERNTRDVPAPGAAPRGHSPWNWARSHGLLARPMASVKEHHKKIILQYLDGDRDLPSDRFRAKLAATKFVFWNSRDRIAGFNWVAVKEANRRCLDKLGKPIDPVNERVTGTEERQMGHIKQQLSDENVHDIYGERFLFDEDE